MFYNKDNPQWKFSEDQNISNGEYDKLVSEYRELTRSFLTTDFRDINEKLYGVKPSPELSEEETASKRKRMMIGGIFCMLGFAGLVLLLIFKQIVLFGYAFSLIFLFAGISILISGKGEVIESTSKSKINRIIGFAMALASLLCILLIFFRDKFSQGEFFILLFVVVFGVAGLALLVVTFIYAFAGKIIYTQDVTATCAGYVRYVSKDEGSNHRIHTFIHTSPLFKYSYEGTQYEAVYDDFPAKGNSDIANGETVTIRVDPKHPENIKSPVTNHPAAIGFCIFMSVACLAVSIGLGIYTAKGYAAGTKVDVKWNPVIEKINGNDPDLIDVTDDIITDNYASKTAPGKEWYYEKGVVISKENTADGTVIEFSDDSFKKIIFKDDTAPEPGSELMLFYVIDENNLQYGIRYKDVITNADPGKYEYVGSHGAYVMTQPDSSR